MQSRSFTFTLNNPEDTDLETLQGLEWIRFGCVGKEVAPTTSTPHLQGYIQLKKDARQTAVAKRLKAALGKQPHVEVARASPDANIAYCSKEGTSVQWGVPTSQGKRSDLKALREATLAGDDDLKLSEDHTEAHARHYKWCDRLRRESAKAKAHKAAVDKYEGAVLKRWQAKAVEDLLAQDDRKIHWYVDEDGNKGKTWLAKYLEVKLGAFHINGGKTADIAYAYNHQDIVVFDFTRTQEETVNYSAIEAFKNSRIFSSKYESAMKMTEGTKVICLSNWEPNRSALSVDRWVITYLKLGQSG